VQQRQQRPPNWLWVILRRSGDFKGAENAKPCLTGIVRAREGESTLSQPSQHGDGVELEQKGFGPSQHAVCAKTAAIPEWDKCRLSRIRAPTGQAERQSRYREIGKQFDVAKSCAKD
jgi:hypothetical protein